MQKSFFYYLTLVTQLGIVIFVTIFIGLFIGIFLDKKLGTNSLFTILCLIFGIIGAFKAAYELIKDIEKR